MKHAHETRFADGNPRLQVQGQHRSLRPSLPTFQLDMETTGD